MFTCFLCKKTFINTNILLRHFDFQHSDHKFDVYNCAEGECSRLFYLKNSYTKHLLKHRKDLVQISSHSQVLPEDNTLLESTATTNTNSDFLPPSNVSSNSKFNIEPVEILNHTLSTFLACLYANPIMPRNAVQIVVDGMETVLSEGIGVFVKSSAQKLLSEGKMSKECFGSFFNIVKHIESALNNFKTEHKRFLYFNKQGSFIEPKEMVIGQRLNKVVKSGISVLEPSTCTQQFIPLRNVLKNFFSVQNVLSETLDHMKTLKSNNKVIQNFIQGTYWQSRAVSHNERVVFPLFVFFDDFESGNALGSHSGIHKLGGVYVSLPCLPSYRSTVLSNIFLALIFHSSDRVEFGNRVIFQPLMDELNFLQETGIEINTPDYEGKLYFELGLILGDNLGLHSIAGFTESFSSNFPCRMCTMRKEDVWVQCYEDESLLRHTDQYYAQLSLNDVSATGVREECIWFSVNNFNLFDQLGVDVMHDMLEGCSKYIMSFILKYYTKELKLFTLQVLNDRLFCFDYGPENNKPCALTEDYIIQGNIRQSASEMLTFVRYFGLLVGDFVPSEEPVWGLYIAMRRVIDVILSTSLELDSCSMLQTLVAEMNDLYLKYSKNRLKPKFHFLTHYHSFIKKFGPVIHLWSMRYEAKHKLSKISARSSFNRRNICKTLAIKHQLKLNETFINGKLCNKIKVGPQTELDSIKQHQIQNELNLNVEDSIFRVNWAEVGGTRYKPKTILTLGILDDNNPQFAIVKNVFLYAENMVIFECNILTTIGFDEHVYCYEITLPETDIIRYVFHDLLLSHVPNTLNVVSNGTKYITVRSPF